MYHMQLHRMKINAIAAIRIKIYITVNNSNYKKNLEYYSKDHLGSSSAFNSHEKKVNANEMNGL